MELFSYYNLSESLSSDNILDELESLSSDLKIDYSYNESREIFRIVDLDLTDDDISKLQKLFEDNDVLPDFDYRSEDEGDYDDLYGFGEDDYDF